MNGALLAAPRLRKVLTTCSRTFLSWLNFSVVLGGLAVGLLNFGDRVGKISAGMFTVVAMSIMVYASVIPSPNLSP